MQKSLKQFRLFLWDLMSQAYDLTPPKESFGPGPLSEGEGGLTVSEYYSIVIDYPVETTPLPSQRHGRVVSF